MKQSIARIFGFSILLLAPMVPAFAASVVLTNGGLGQVAGNTQSFGIAVCNKGTQALGQSVPLSVSAAGQVAAIESTAPTPAGSCSYTYVNYSQFGMTAGQTYTVTVTIDPQHTLTSNANNQATYDVTVPGTSAQAETETQTAASGNNNLLAYLGSVLVNFFSALKSILGF